MDKKSFKDLIKSNIVQHGFHITVVGGAIEPRFAYTIGLLDRLAFELVFAGGIYYMKDEVLQIIREIVNNLKTTSGLMDQRITIEHLGEFSFLPVDPSWSKLMLLGAFDYYNKAEIQAYQIIPDANHFTYDIPDMSKEWSLSEPVWQWLVREWDYSVPAKSKVITNLEALKGEPITEMARYEEDEWEMFAGSGEDTKEEDGRIVSLGTILGIDSSLLPALDLEIDQGLWRTDRDSEWQNWE
jgi:hypothetical protein